MPRTPNEFDPTHGLNDRDKYVVMFNTHLDRILRRQVSAYLTDETVSRETLRLCEHLDEMMRRYPDPHALARAVATGGRPVIGTVRTENAQRGAGVKATRKVLSLDAGSENGFDEPNHRPRGHRPDPRVDWEPTAQHMPTENRLLLQALLAPLKPRERAVLMLVDGYGYSVTEAAARLGIARETAARDRSNAFRSIDRHPPV